MKPPLAWALAFIAGCSGGRRGEDPLPAPLSDGRRERDDAIVALFDGEPLRWRTVAEKMIEIDPRTAVETYVRWRLVDDRRKELGIALGPEELHRRAEAHVDRVKRTLPAQEFRARLASEGLEEKDYVQRLAVSPWLTQTLTLDLIVRYQALTDGTLTIDRLSFTDEARARRFKALCREKGFDAAADETTSEKAAGVRRLPRETFSRRSPPADPILDAWIVEALDRLSPGETTDVESSRSDLRYVVRLVEKREGRPAPFAQARAALLEGILKDPPAPEQARAWLSSRLERVRLEYPAAGGRGRGTNN